MEIKSLNNMCFCTLALGKRYNKHATFLANDLQKYAPEYKLLILTNQPELFKDLHNTIALKHSQISIGCFHDKREVIKQALHRFDSCLFLDSDIRILERVPDNISWQEGISAFSLSPFLKHLNKYSGSLKNRELLESITAKIGLDKQDQELKFIQEFCFAVSKSNGKELLFLDYWEKISIFLELNGFTFGEGFTIGLAAAKANFPTHYRGESMEKMSIFKDWLERDKLEKNIEVSAKALECWEEHKKIEFSKKSIIDRIVNKVIKILKREYLTLRLRLKTLEDLDFYS